VTPKPIHYKQQLLKLNTTGGTMATIGEILTRVSITALELLERIEQEPLNTPDFVNSQEYKTKKEVIKRSEARTR